MKPSAEYVRLAGQAIRCGEDQLAESYLGLAEESRRQAELRRRLVASFLESQKEPQ